MVVQQLIVCKQYRGFANEVKICYVDLEDMSDTDREKWQQFVDYHHHIEGVSWNSMREEDLPKLAVWLKKLWERLEDHYYTKPPAEIANVYCVYIYNCCE